MDGRSLNLPGLRQVLAQGEIGQRLPIGIPDDAAWSRHGVLGYLASHMLFGALAQIAGRLTAGAITAWPIILHIYLTGGGAMGHAKSSQG